MSDFRARSAAEILDVSVEIYRRYFPLFLAAGVVAALPSAIAQYTTLSMARGLGPVAARATGTGLPVLPSYFFALYGAAMLAMLVNLFLTPLTDGVSVTATANAYRGEPVDLGEAVRAVLQRPLAVILAYWARLIVAIVFSIALFIPIAIVGGIVVGLLGAASPILAVILGLAVGIGMILVMAFIWKRYFAVIPVVLVEKVRVSEAMHRSRILSDGYGWRIIGLVGGVILMVFVFAMILGGIALALHSIIVAAVVYLFGIALASQLTSVIITVLYFDLRIRKEGYDIELLAGSLAPAAVPAIAPTELPATA